MQVIAFDADDTLWMNEPIFQEVEHRVEEILGSYLPQPNLKTELYAREKVNLALFGYGAKGFVLSLIETAIQLTEGRITADDIHRIIEMGKEMLSRPIELLPGVAHALHELEEKYPLMLLTKGDLLDQESKLARSGLARHFRYVEIVSEKHPQAYQDILTRNQIAADRFLMVGNSVKSDILPVIEIGGHAIHVPYHTTWVHEQVADSERAESPFVTMQNMEEVLNSLYPGHS